MGASQYGGGDKVKIEINNRSKYKIGVSLTSIDDYGSTNDSNTIATELPNKVLILMTTPTPTPLVSFPSRAITTATSDEETKYYYFVIPSQTTSTYEIDFEKYSATVYYYEPYDPVYGYQCSSKSSTIKAYRNLKMTVTNCDSLTKKRGGEANIIKY